MPFQEDGRTLIFEGDFRKIEEYRYIGHSRYMLTIYPISSGKSYRSNIVNMLLYLTSNCKFSLGIDQMFD